MLSGGPREGRGGVRELLLLLLHREGRGGVRELLLLLLYDHTRNTMPEARALPLARLDRTWSAEVSHDHIPTSAQHAARRVWCCQSHFLHSNNAALIYKKANHPLYSGHLRTGELGTDDSYLHHHVTTRRPALDGHAAAMERAREALMRLARL